MMKCMNLSHFLSSQVIFIKLDFYRETKKQMKWKVPERQACLWLQEITQLFVTFLSVLEMLPWIWLQSKGGKKQI